MIELRSVSKWYGKFPVLKNINLKVEKGEVVVICGPSGSGKSTLIRTINGLEKIQEGKIVVDNKDLSDRSYKINDIRMGIGFVFQNFNLFPHLSVARNLTIGPMKLKGSSQEEAIQVSRRLLEQVGLSDKFDSYPDNLSGGQQQRVAIARALAMAPTVMLFDEPTSALDPEMVGEVLKVIAGLKKDGMTMVCVTHEMAFARKVADRIVFMDAGEILQIQGSKDFFESPEHERVIKFLADVTPFHVRQ